MENIKWSKGLQNKTAYGVRGSRLYNLLYYQSNFYSANIPSVARLSGANESKYTATLSLHTLSVSYSPWDTVFLNNYFAISHIPAAHLEDRSEIQLMMTKIFVSPDTLRQNISKWMKRDKSAVSNLDCSLWNKITNYVLKHHKYIFQHSGPRHLSTNINKTGYKTRGHNTTTQTQLWPSAFSPMFNERPPLIWYSQVWP